MPAAADRRRLAVLRYAMFPSAEAAGVVAGSVWTVARVLHDGWPRWMMIIERASEAPGIS